MMAFMRPRERGVLQCLRVVGLPVVTLSLLILVLLMPPILPSGGAQDLRQIERIEGRSVAKLDTGFVFVSTFASIHDAKILGGWVEHTDGFYERVYATEVHYGGAIMKFIFGVECGQPVTIIFHILYLAPDGRVGEYIRDITYYC